MSDEAINQINERLDEIYQETIDKLQQEIKQLKEDIRFCLKSINQERLTSTDERTRKEMTTCYEILKKWVG